MKKNLFFLAMLIFTISLVSCSKEDFTTSDLKSKEASTRSNSLTLTVTYKNKTVSNYTASKYVIVDEADGFRVSLNPGTESSQTLNSVESISINGGTFNVTRSNGTIYNGKTYLQASDGLSGMEVKINPDNITFTETQIIVEELDGF